MNSIAEPEVTVIRAVDVQPPPVEVAPGYWFDLAAMIRGEPVYAIGGCQERRVYFVAYVPVAQRQPLVMLDPSDNQIILYRSDGRFHLDGEPCCLDLFTRKD